MASAASTAADTASWASGSSAQSEAWATSARANPCCHESGQGLDSSAARRTGSTRRKPRPVEKRRCSRRTSSSQTSSGCSVSSVASSSASTVRCSTSCCPRMAAASLRCSRSSVTGSAGSRRRGCRSTACWRSATAAAWSPSCSAASSGAQGPEIGFVGFACERVVPGHCGEPCDLARVHHAGVRGQVRPHRIEPVPRASCAVRHPRAVTPTPRPGGGGGTSTHPRVRGRALRRRRPPEGAGVAPGVERPTGRRPAPGQAPRPPRHRWRPRAPVREPGVRAAPRGAAPRS